MSNVGSVTLLATFYLITLPLLATFYLIIYKPVSSKYSNLGHCRICRKYIRSLFAPVSKKYDRKWIKKVVTWTFKTSTCDIE